MAQQERFARGVTTPRHAQRALNAPLGRFFASLMPCSNLWIQKEHHPVGWCSFWRSRRDSNSRYAFGVHTISSRARYDHFDTTPYSVSTALSSRFAQALSCDSDMYYNRYSPFVKYFLKISFYFFRPTVHLGQMVPRRTDWGIQECPGVGSAPKIRSDGTAVSNLIQAPLTRPLLEHLPPLPCLT